MHIRFTQLLRWLPIVLQEVVLAVSDSIILRAAEANYSFGSRLPTIWNTDVPHAWRSVGHQPFGLSNSCYGAISVHILRLWQEDQGEESICVGIVARDLITFDDSIHMIFWVILLLGIGSGMHSGVAFKRDWRTTY
jgi:hypothetical protein